MASLADPPGHRAAATNLSHDAIQRRVIASGQNAEDLGSFHHSPLDPIRHDLSL
jgi:hypothetical protein